MMLYGAAVFAGWSTGVSPAGVNPEAPLTMFQRYLPVESLAVRTLNSVSGLVIAKSGKQEAAPVRISLIPAATVSRGVRVPEAEYALVNVPLVFSKPLNVALAVAPAGIHGLQRHRV